MNVSINNLIQGNLRVAKRPDGSIVLNTAKSSIKSVSSPSAQSTILCVPVYDWGSTCEALLESIKEIGKYSKIHELMFLVMYYSGCRVSEVLRLKRKDILNGNYVCIKASKSSENRIVQVPLINEFNYLKHVKNDDYLFKISRYSVYRLSIKYRLNMVGEGVFYDKPTKLFRYALASLIYSQTKDLELVARMLGHKVIENAKYYIYELDVVVEERKGKGNGK